MKGAKRSMVTGKMVVEFSASRWCSSPTEIRQEKNTQLNRKVFSCPLPLDPYFSSFAIYSPTSLENFLINGVKRSMGTGKMVVEFFSVATSVKVCKNLS
jgi:hypothetical protein